MERTLSCEERIRRAEEIYARRRINNGIRVSTNATATNTKRQYGLFKKVILQVLICLLIYFIFYLIKNSNYIFSENVLNSTRDFLSYDMSFEKIYNEIEEFYNKNIKDHLIKYDKSNDENITDEKLENSISDKKKENKETNEEMGIGGGEEDLLENEIIYQENINDEEEIELSQMEIDARDIKENYNLIVPIQGIISSRFGPRTPTDIVSSNHAGIDIAANEGTIFYASMDGVVTYVSSEGGYGNHFWIQKDDVVTLYAHCSNIYVKEGDIISQGDEIGEVGQTGNATGPHLHFEIRKENRAVDPELILEF